MFVKLSPKAILSNALGEVVQRISAKFAFKYKSVKTHY